MSEAEKQEGQKTVVAFITGLLIGGLLVWVFSSSPEKSPVNSTEGDETADTVNNEGSSETQQNATLETKTDTQKQLTAEIKKPAAQVVTGEGMLKVDDQTSGKTVTLADTKFPTSNGWIVVRDYKNDTPGNILGAARYSIEEGLLPKTVELLRETTPGSSYQVVYYTESGDKQFKLADDTLIGEIAATFKAQ